MTPSPVCANTNSPASDALTLMVEKGFRHLPVLDDDNHITGVLDITKSYAQQMEKLERLHDSSRKLYEALDSVHLEIGVSDQPHHVYEYFADLKSKMDGPKLLSVLDETTVPVYATNRTTVYEATLLMKKHRTTAVLIKDPNEGVTGIFTSKDVVLRVIAAGLDPHKCSLVRVMTPHPDVASLDTSIQRALRQMFDGNYLNLPVVDEDSEIVGIVDVLKLTYVTLNQIKRIELNPPSIMESSGHEQRPNEGPAWNKFWTSLDNEDSDSMHSGSAASAPDVTPSEFNLFNADIGPADSVSAVGGSSKIETTASSVLTDDSFVFKFKSPGVPGRVNRITLKQQSTLEDLRKLIDEKLQPRDYEALRGPGGESEPYAISYRDDEGDIVSITSDVDLGDCILVNRVLLLNKADLFIHNIHEVVIIEEKEPVIHPFKVGEVIAGVPNHILLTGAIALSSAIAAVVLVTRKH